MLPDIIFSISLDIDPRHQESPYLFAPIPLVNTSDTEKKVKVSMVLDWNKHDTEKQVGREQNISTIGPLLSQYVTIHFISIINKHNNNNIR